MKYNRLKYIIIPFLAIGCVLLPLPFPFFWVEYHCDSSELFPNFYGNPFIFKMDFMGSSLEYIYSIVGLLYNYIFWVSIIILLRLAVRKIFRLQDKDNLFRIIYKAIIGAWLIFTFVIILLVPIEIRGFEWYIDFDEFTKNRNDVECKKTR